MQSTSHEISDWPAEEGVPVQLHKFRTFGAIGRDGRDKTTVFNLLSGRLPFSRLKDFNDPFEGRPYPVPAFSDAGQQRNAIGKYATQILRDSGLSPAQARKKVDEYLAGKSIAEVSESLGLLARQTYAADDLLILCLSSGAAVQAPLTWSHYADSHQGLCVHFDGTQYPFKLAWSVKYSENYPEVVFPRTYRDDWDGIVAGLLWKCSLWSYEHEFRLMRIFGNENLGISGTLGVDWEEQVAVSSPRAVLGVTLGVRMSEPARAEIVRWIDENAPHLEIWRASLHQRRYEIVRERIR